MSDQGKPSIVFCHGLWADGSCFSKLIAPLQADGHQVVVFVVLGHKADIGLMALGPDLARLHSFQQELLATPLVPVSSYLSLTELSEYTSTEDDERARLSTEEGVSGDELETKLAAWRDRMAHYAEHRLHPQLPAKKLISFYPMSKRRDAVGNWYELPFEDRKGILFIGNFRHAPNLSAVEYLCGEVLPPGISGPRSTKCRPFNGISCTVFESITVPTDTLAVSMRGASAVTLTCSATAATFIVTSTRVERLTCSVTSRAWVPKPANVTSMWYVPGVVGAV